MKKKEGIIYKVNLDNSYEDGLFVGVTEAQYQNITDINVVLKDKASLFPKDQLNKISFHSYYDRYISGCKTNSLLNFKLEIVTLDKELVEKHKDLLVKKYNEILNELINKHKHNIENIQYNDVEYYEYAYDFSGSHESRIFN